MFKRKRHIRSVMCIELHDGTIILCTEVQKTRKAWYFKSLPLEESMIIAQFKVRSVETMTEYYHRTNQLN